LSIFNRVRPSILHTTHFQRLTHLQYSKTLQHNNSRQTMDNKRCPLTLYATHHQASEAGTKQIWCYILSFSELYIESLLNWQVDSSSSCHCGTTTHGTPATIRAPSRFKTLWCNFSSWSVTCS
jgi:hypothetical protein